MAGPVEVLEVTFDTTVLVRSDVPAPAPAAPPVQASEDYQRLSDGAEVAVAKVAALPLEVEGKFLIKCASASSAICL
jgi:hypothetical protein